MERKLAATLVGRFAVLGPALFCFVFSCTESPKQRTPSRSPEFGKPITVEDGIVIPWSAPPSLAMNRMECFKSQDYSGDFFYAATWNADGKPLLVAAHLLPFGSMRDVYEIKVFGAGNHLVSCGALSVVDPSVLFCLLEVKDEGSDLPPPYAGKWDLAIADLYQRDSEFDPKKRICFFTDQHPDDSSCTWVHVELVNWHACNSETTRNFVSLNGLRHLRVRLAESVLVKKIQIDSHVY